MIRYICGTVTDMEENCIILENHGVGYRIFMSASAMGGHVRVGDEMKIHTYMSVREDAMLLYGFLTRDDLRLFELLIGVSGIGPKGGLSILSALSADELRFAILSDDAASIARAPGIGKKTAQKLILELKDK
ncbi:MAG TPA: Holliday junction branch migration protein RuvA, partial [Lachnospiraceae bacterium]|nr:Holliday junction branch migration protein RuvA [Lachnospiraceae bacterium]